MNNMSDGDRVTWIAGQEMDATVSLGAMLAAREESMTPLEILLKREAGEDTEEADNADKFGFLTDLMNLALREEFDREPAKVNWVLWTLVGKYYPSLVAGIPAEVAQAQKAGEHWVRLKRDELSSLVGEECSLRRELFRTFLSRVIFEGVRSADPMMPTKKLYGVAKMFFPERIDGMSLHALGAMFEPDKNAERGRARWSARLKTWFFDKISAQGFVAHATFQKSAASSEAYRQAQMGNNNRVKNLASE